MWLCGLIRGTPPEGSALGKSLPHGLLTVNPQDMTNNTTRSARDKPPRDTAEAVVGKTLWVPPESLPTPPQQGSTPHQQ